MNDRATRSQTATTEGQAHLRGWALVSVLAGLLLTLFLSTLDATIVGTALPSIARELHGFEQYSWVVTAYLLVSTTIVPIVGKLSDQFGRKWFLLAGIALFLLGSALAGTSGSMIQLILFRGLQGLGAGCMQTIVFTLVADIFTPAERGRWQGVFVGVAVLSSIIGPAIGGWITDHTNWRWVFYVNLPAGLLALLVLTAWLPATISLRSTSSHGRPLIRRIDITGALIAAAATTCLLLGLTWGGSAYPWTSVPVLGILGAAAVLYLAFLINERFAVEPLLPLDLFRSQVFSASGLLGLALGMVIYAVIFYLPLFIQGVLGQSASNSGAGLTPFFIPLAISAVLGGQVIAKIGRYHILSILGALILLAGSFLLTRMDTTTGLTTVILNMVVVGVGIGILQPIYTLAGQNAIPMQRMGAGTGAITYLRAMGSLVGTAVLGAIVAQPGGGAHAAPLAHAARQTLAVSVGHAFLVTFGVCAAIVVVTLFLKDVPLRTRAGEPPAGKQRSAATAGQTDEHDLARNNGHS